MYFFWQLKKIFWEFWIEIQKYIKSPHCAPQNESKTIEIAARAFRKTVSKLNGKLCTVGGAADLEDGRPFVTQWLSYYMCRGWILGKTKWNRSGTDANTHTCIQIGYTFVWQKTMAKWKMAPTRINLECVVFCNRFWEAEFSACKVDSLIRRK